MKAITLTLTTLGLVVLAQANVDYHLKCTKEEIGVRWPSYHSNSEYYVCPRVGGRQMVISCNAGELFTFVLQSCTTPSKFIPPPPMDVLPTSSSFVYEPINYNPGSGSNQQNNGQMPSLPKPHYPSVMGPPIVNHPNPNGEVTNNWELPKPVPHQEEPEHHEDSDSEEHEHDGPLIMPPLKPSLPGKPKPSVNKPEAPLPPTPAPTPPVMTNDKPGKKPVPNKKPQAPAKKPTLPAKKTAPKPAEEKKKSPTPPSKA